MTDHLDTIAIRSIRPEDIPDVHELIAAIYAEYNYRLDVENDDAESHLRNPHEYFRAFGGDFWVAEVNGKILGTVAVKCGENDAELKSLYVAVTARGRGLGRRLVNHVMDFCRGQGLARLVLWSDVNFEDAHRLYTRLNFRQDLGIRDLHDFNNSQEYGFSIDL